MVQRAQAIITSEIDPLEYNVKMDLINTILTITEGKVHHPSSHCFLLQSVFVEKFS